MLERLNQVNDVPVVSVFDECFRTYGNVLTGFDFAPLCRYLETETPAETRPTTASNTTRDPRSTSPRPT